jgi:hypothetical protein
MFMKIEEQTPPVPQHTKGTDLNDFRHHGGMSKDHAYFDSEVRSAIRSNHSFNLEEKG